VLPKRQNKDLLNRVTIELCDEALMHTIAISNVFTVLINIGGLWVAITGVFKIFLMCYQPDLVEYELARSFFRKPEMQKYAKAEQLDYNLVLSGKMSLGEFEAK